MAAAALDTEDAPRAPGLPGARGMVEAERPRAGDARTMGDAQITAGGRRDAGAAAHAHHATGHRDGHREAHAPGGGRTAPADDPAAAAAPCRPSQEPGRGAS